MASSKEKRPQQAPTPFSFTDDSDFITNAPDVSTQRMSSATPETHPDSATALAQDRTTTLPYFPSQSPLSRPLSADVFHGSEKARPLTRSLSGISAPFTAMSSVLGFGKSGTLLDVKAQKGVIKEVNERISDVASVGSAVDSVGEARAVGLHDQKGETAMRSFAVELPNSERFPSPKKTDALGSDAAVKSLKDLVDRTTPEEETFGAKTERGSQFVTEGRLGVVHGTGDEWWSPDKTSEGNTGVGEGKELFNSFFDGSSDEDGEENKDDQGAHWKEGEGIMVGEAQQATFRRPVVVGNSSSPKVGLREMLSSTPVGGSGKTGLSEGKRRILLGEEVELMDLVDRRSSNTDIPSTRESKIHSTVLSTPPNTDSIGLAVWASSPDRNSINGLRSHPVSPKQTRRVTLAPSEPFSISVLPEHRFLRPTRVSTPYAYSTDSPSQPTAPNPSTPPEAILTLVLYSTQTPHPIIRPLTLPTPTPIPLHSSGDKNHPPTIATLAPKRFDDSHLFKSLHTTYASMRGRLSTLLSARTIVGLRLLSYRSTSQLAIHRGRIMRFRAHTEEEDMGAEFAESRMLALWRCPRKGRGKEEWVAWVRSLPGNPAGGGVEEGRERIAVELVEGWAAAWIGVAVAGVVAVSVLVFLLWVYLGAGGVGVRDSGDGMLRFGLRGPGGRVETGGVLGVLVLLLGSVVIGGWVGVSWLAG